MAVEARPLDSAYGSIRRKENGGLPVSAIPLAVVFVPAATECHWARPGPEIQVQPRDATKRAGAGDGFDGGLSLSWPSSQSAHRFRHIMGLLGNDDAP